jgi:predicted RNA-binding Zn ribbon-like protein
LAGAVGLDFLNAITPNAATPYRALVTGEDLVAWLARAGLIDAGACSERLEDGSQELDAVAMQAREIGAWFREFVLAHLGRPLPADAFSGLAPLNALLELDTQFLQIEVLVSEDGPRLVRRDRRACATSRALLAPLAESMSRLVCGEHFSLVRVCEGPSCGRLFLDQTRRRARRWCDMAVCGNRAKQAAHKRRLASNIRAQSAGT